MRDCGRCGVSPAGASRCPMGCSANATSSRGASSSRGAGLTPRTSADVARNLLPSSPEADRRIDVISLVAAAGEYATESSLDSADDGDEDDEATEVDVVDVAAPRDDVDDVRVELSPVETLCSSWLLTSAPAVPVNDVRGCRSAAAGAAAAADSPSAASASLVGPKYSCSPDR